MKSHLAAMAAFSLLLGCSEQEVVAELRSLQGSEDVVFVCRDHGGNGRPFAECPDRDDSDNTALSILALVSQTVTNEIALVDITAGDVVDVDPSTPGFGFLRVGGRPVSMATTPGGLASFVATADVGRNGIFALPTTCLGAPRPGQTQRDLTTWPACRLHATPGEIAVVVDSAGADGCESSPPLDDASSPECSANLADERGEAGARKLVVSLPDAGQVAVLDAQQLLNVEPGTFPDCEVEYYVDLKADVPPGAAQALPPDLETSCSEVPAPMAPPPSRRASRPAGFALSENRLYIADEAAPVIHVLDTSNACSLQELAPLLPMSLREPERVVTTTRVAASPPTPSGKRYVYAIDAEDQPGASVMAFDVSPGSTDPTPIVRSGSPELPGEKPDRLALGSSARDVTFAYRDLPYADPLTGVAEFGTLCDPNPLVSSDEPGGRARPSDDYTVGARPGLLRGLFGFVLLTDGSIAVVDVEDFDAPCRRPREGNPNEGQDFRGCVGPDVATDFAIDDVPTVTDEVSCRVVEPHRFRSARLAVNDADVGVRAPSLRAFPQLNLPPSSASSSVEDRPRMLSVPFASGEPAEVFVGSTLYAGPGGQGEPLPVDPNSRESEQLQSFSSLVLPPLQPRAYAAEDTVSVTYEGSYAGDRSAGFLSADGVLRDSSLSFCAAGTYDVAAMADYGRTVLGLEDDDVVQAFAEEHADYVQITSAVPDEDDSYWQARGVDRKRCLDTFGPHDAETFHENRDFTVQQAFGDRLVLAPAPGSDATTEFASQCFPTANKYRLRGGRHWIVTHAAFGFRHDVVESGSERACVRSCNPLRKWSRGRAFEISSEAPNCRVLPPDGEPPPEGDPLELRVGCALEGEVACVYDQGPAGSENSGVQIGGRASECIFDGLTERFALYRGRRESVRDASFAWQTTGGFTPLVMSLSGLSSAVSPQSMQFLRQPEVLAVVDGSSLGLSLFSLDTFEVTEPSPFY